MRRASRSAGGLLAAARLLGAAAAPVRLRVDLEQIADSMPMPAVGLPADAPERPADADRPIRRSMTCRRRAQRCAADRRPSSRSSRTTCAAARDQQQAAAGVARQAGRKADAKTGKAAAAGSRHERRSTGDQTEPVIQGLPGFSRRPEWPTARQRSEPMEEFLPHPAPAALRVRAGQPGQGRARATPAPTSSISAWAIRTCRRRRTSSRS